MQHYIVQIREKSYVRNKTDSLNGNRSLSSNYHSAPYFSFSFWPFKAIVGESPLFKFHSYFLILFSRHRGWISALVLIFPFRKATEKLQFRFSSLFKAIGGESPRAVVDTMADVLLALNKHQFDALCQWMNSVVARQGFPNPRVTNESKEMFARRILKLVWGKSIYWDRRMAKDPVSD